MKKVVIIGATSGIGNELAKIYADRNCLVGIAGRRIKLLSELKATDSDHFITKQLDCTQNDAIEKLEHLTAEMNGMDVLIFSAGIGELNENLDYALEQPTIDLNISAFTKIINWAYHYFEQKKDGQLVVISSIGGLRGSRVAPAYNASKAYQINYLEGLQQKSTKAKNNIYISDIRPGLVDTQMAKGDGLFWVMPTEKVARQIFSKIERKKPVGYVTKRWKPMALLFKMIPKWLYKKM